MPHTILRVVLVCPSCGHRSGDPVVVLTARIWKAKGIRLGCIKCERAKRRDVEMVETQEPFTLLVDEVPGENEPLNAGFKLLDPEKT